MTATMHQPNNRVQTVLAEPATPDARKLEQVLDATELLLARRLSQTAGAYAGAIEAAADHLEKSVVISVGINKLRTLLSDQVMDAYVMPLMNSDLGFLTDKDPAKAREGKATTIYPRETVRECVIAGLLAGLRHVGNEFNIIAGRMMPVKNGWRRLVLESPGVTDADLQAGTPAVDGGTARVKVYGWVNRDGQLIELLDQDRKAGRTLSIPIKSAQYETADTWKGKAERRGWKALWERLHGAKRGELLGTDEEEATLPPTPANGTPVHEAKQEPAPQTKTEQLAAKIGGVVVSEAQVAEAKKGAVALASQIDNDEIVADELAQDFASRIACAADQPEVTSLVNEASKKTEVLGLRRIAELREIAEARRKVLAAPYAAKKARDI